MPGGTSVPPINFPGRKPKDKNTKSSEETHTTVASVDGTMRKLGEKDLLLRELRHRTKNDIMSIGSILRLQSRRSSTEEVRDALMAAARRGEVAQ